MNKTEFLSILRESLYKEVTVSTIEQNIQYYDQYIGNHSTQEEEKIINDLGDPRLIARTIIETEKMAKQKERFTGNQNYRESGYNYQDSNEQKESNSGSYRNSNKRNKPLFFTNLRWYHKVAAILIFIFFLLILMIVGRILFTFGLPILLILMVLYLFRRR